MALTNLSDVANQIQKFWSPLMAKELRANLLLGSLINKDYQGEIKQGGDTVYVSQVQQAAGQLKATSDNTFTPEALVTKRIPIVADSIAIASFEFSDLAMLQSQIGSAESDIRASLLYAVQKNIDAQIKSKIAPAAANVYASIAAMTAAQLRTVRTQASKSLWSLEKGWYGLLDPAYFGDLLGDATIANSQFTGETAPVVAGQMARQRYGFNLLEDNSKSDKTALFFHPDFAHLVMQQDVTFKVSDLHSNNKFGYVISAHVVFGAALGVDGDKKHITVRATV